MPTSATTWEVRLYNNNQIGPWGGSIYNQAGKIAFQTIAFSAQWTDGSFTQFTQLAVTESGDLGNRNRTFDWNNTGTDHSWTLDFPDPVYGSLRKESVSENIDASGFRTSKTKTIMAGDGTILARTSDTYQSFPWGPEIVAETTENFDSTGAAVGDARTVNTSFYQAGDSAPGALTGRIKETWENAGEKWVQYQYDAAGRVTQRRSQYLDAPRTAADSACRVETTVYSQADLNSDGNIDLVTMRTTLLLGQAIARSFVIAYGGDGAYFTRKEVVVADLTISDASTALATSSSLITTTRTFGGTYGTYPYGKVHSVQTPDGVLRTTRYSADFLTTTVAVGSGDAGGNNVVAGQKTVTVNRGTGGLLSETVTDIVSGKVLSQTVVTAWDAFGRPTAFSYLDGTTSSQNFDCCGLNNETDREGVTTTYVRDSLKRVREQTRAGITTKFTLDALGRTTQTQRVAGGTTITTATTAFDSFGHPLTQTDALARTTTVAESTDVDGHRVVTTTFPGGGTRIETYAKDGSLLTVAGTAAARVNYGYGVDADGSFVKEIKVGSDDETTEWTKSYTDFAGRTFKSVTPTSTSTSYFNSLGQLVRAVDPDGVQTLYDYDSLGRPSVTAVDMDRDGVIDFDGTDRITRTTRSFVTAHSKDVERTVTETWITDNSATPTTVATVDRSVDGLSSWTTASGLTTSTSTVINAVAGTRTETITAPDLTSAVRTFTAGRLASEARRAVDGTVLELARFGYDAHSRLVETRRYADTTTAAADSVSTALPSVFSLQPSAPGVLATTYTYFDDDQIHTVTTPPPTSTSTSTSTSYQYDSAGRLWKTLLPDLTETVREYFPTGQLKKTSGSRTYPQEYTYDSQGRLKTLKTWQNFANATGASVTTWNYDSVRGWLTSKVYPATSTSTSTSTSYSYYPSGRTKTRTWARTVAGQPLVTTYTFNNAGDLSTIDYSDATPDVGFGYDRLGRRTSTTDAAGTLVTTYEGLTAATDDETYAADSPLLPGLAITRTRDTLLRPASLSSLPSLPSVNHSYSPNTGRLDTITAGDLTHTYAYQPQSSLIATLTQSRAGAPVLTTTKAYDHLHRLTSVTSTSTSNLNSPSVSAAYAYNSANQRTRLTREDGAYWSYGYDALGQVTAATKHLPDDAPSLTPAFAFTFDDIGNRLTAERRLPSSVALAKEEYTANAVNQYDSRTVPPAVDILGSAHPDATVTVNFQPTTRQGPLWAAQLTVDNTAAPVYTAARVIGVRSNQGPNGEDAVAEETRHAFVAQTPEIFTHDLDGNLTQDGRWTYTWDAENRLIEMVGRVDPNAASPRQKLTFAYDSAGRRLAKRVYLWNLATGVWDLTADTRFLYDGWNLAAEFSVQSSVFSVQRSYTWGLDLSGSAQGAGGVGGLLSVDLKLPTSTSSAGIFLPAYDGNGNILAAYDAATGTRVAEFEYGPFGEVLKATGPTAAALPFGFSTKYTDSETGLLYYGLRYYNPSTGRWPSRDPIEEEGGANLYGFVGNDPINSIDPFGEAKFQMTLGEGLVFRGTLEITHDKTKDCCDLVKTSVEIEAGLGAGIGVQIGKVVNISVGIMVVGLGRKETDEFMLCPNGQWSYKNDKQILNVSKFLSQALYIGGPSSQVYGGAKIGYDMEASMNKIVTINRHNASVDLRAKGFYKITGAAAMKLWKITLGQSAPDDQSEILAEGKFDKLIASASISY